MFPFPRSPRLRAVPRHQVVNARVWTLVRYWLLADALVLGVVRVELAQVIVVSRLIHAPVVDQQASLVVTHSLRVREREAADSALEPRFARYGDVGASLTHFKL